MQITGGSPGLSYHLAKPPLKTPFETPLTSWLFQLSALEKQPKFAQLNRKRQLMLYLGLWVYVGAMSPVAHSHYLCPLASSEKAKVKVVVVKAGERGHREQDLIWLFPAFKLGRGKVSSHTTPNGLNLNSERCLKKNTLAVPVFGWLQSQVTENLISFYIFPMGNTGFLILRTQ